MKFVSLLAALPLAVTAAGGSEISAKVQVPGTPCGVGGTAGSVWVSDATFGKLFRIDAAKGIVAKTVPRRRDP